MAKTPLVHIQMANGDVVHCTKVRRGPFKVTGTGVAGTRFVIRKSEVVRIEYDA